MNLRFLEWVVDVLSELDAEQKHLSFWAPRWTMLKKVLRVIVSWGRPCLVAKSSWDRYGRAGLPPTPTCGP
jgi:hypothetical protein